MSGAGWKETEWTRLGGRRQNGQDLMKGGRQAPTDRQTQAYRPRQTDRQTDPDRPTQTVRPRQTHPDRDTQTVPRTRVLLTDHCHHMQTLAKRERAVWPLLELGLVLELELEQELEV